MALCTPYAAPAIWLALRARHAHAAQKWGKKKFTLKKFELEKIWDFPTTQLPLHSTHSTQLPLHSLHSTTTPLHSLHSTTTPLHSLHSTTGICIKTWQFIGASATQSIQTGVMSQPGWTKNASKIVKNLNFDKIKKTYPKKVVLNLNLYFLYIYIDTPMLQSVWHTEWVVS